MTQQSKRDLFLILAILLLSLLAYLFRNKLRDWVWSTITFPEIEPVTPAPEEHTL